MPAIMIVRILLLIGFQPEKGEDACVIVAR